MDLGAFAALSTSLQAATDVIGRLLTSKVDSQTQRNIAAIQSALLAAQSAALAANEERFRLTERVRELETRLSARENWHEVQVRYELTSPWRGSGGGQVYALREALANDQTPHFACTSCFHRERVEILQPAKQRDGFISMVCSACRAAVHTGYRGIGSPKYAEEYRLKAEGEQ